MKKYLAEMVGTFVLTFLGCGAAVSLNCGVDTASVVGTAIAFGAGEYYEATAQMKQFTGDIPHNNGYYYTEETIYGRAVADDSDLFETFSSESFHEYLPLQEPTAATILSTDTKPGVPYQLVVTNSAGLYRYVTDHIVCIQETLLDKILFTIY